MSTKKVHKIGIIMNGVTGRMGLNQHLRRSILPIQEQGGVAEGAAEKRAKKKSEGGEIFLVTGEGSVRNAAAYEKDWNVAAARLMKAVGPNFRLKNDDEPRPTGGLLYTSPSPRES